VAPAAYLPKMAPSFAIVNLEPTPYDCEAELVIRGRAGEILPSVVDALEQA